jgi:uncharacterized membrane protein YcaP (DUF421 family)
MEAVIRATLAYAFLLLLLRLAGKRTLAQVTTFDFVLLLIISEATQQALVDGDNSMINAAVVVTTLVGLNILLSVLKQRFKSVERVLDGLPLRLVQDGEAIQDRMDKERVDMEDVMDAARDAGLEKFEQIKHATLERNGKISIVPRR